MMRRACSRQRGVTLVELLMVLTITALVMVPVVAMLGTSVAAGTATATRATLEQDARFALERIAAEVRATPRKVLAPNASPSDSGNWFDKSRFQQAGEQLIERRDGIDNVVAESVSAFSITARSVGVDATLVEATLELKRGAEVATASTMVRMGGPRW